MSCLIKSIQLFIILKLWTEATGYLRLKMLNIRELVQKPSSSGEHSSAGATFEKLRKQAIVERQIIYICWRSEKNSISQEPGGTVSVTGCSNGVINHATGKKELPTLGRTMCWNKFTEARQLRWTVLVQYFTCICFLVISKAVSTFWVSKGLILFGRIPFYGQLGWLQGIC